MNKLKKRFENFYQTNHNKASFVPFWNWIQKHYTPTSEVEEMLGDIWTIVYRENYEDGDKREGVKAIEKYLNQYETKKGQNT